MVFHMTGIWYIDLHGWLIFMVFHMTGIWNIDLHGWLIFMVNVCKYTIHGSYGNDNNNNLFLKNYFPYFVSKKMHLERGPS